MVEDYNNKYQGFTLNISFFKFFLQGESKKAYCKADRYLEEIRELSQKNKCVVKELSKFLRVLKSRKFCALLIIYSLRHKHMVPLFFITMQFFLEAFFILKDNNIIKSQNNTETESLWKNMSFKHNYLLLVHSIYLYLGPKNVEN